MKKILLIILALIAIKANAQDLYKIDGSAIVVSRVIDSIQVDKDGIYGRAKTYLARAYNDSKSVIQTDDKENGLIIVKGLYANIASFSLGAWTMKAYHTIRIDIKDNRARIIVSASTIVPNSSAYPGNGYEYSIIDYAPITDKRAPGALKKAQEEALEKLVALMNASADSLGAALKEGGVLNTEKEDW